MACTCVLTHPLELWPVAEYKLMEMCIGSAVVWWGVHLCVLSACVVSVLSACVVSVVLSACVVSVLSACVVSVLSACVVSVVLSAMRPLVVRPCCVVCVFTMIGVLLVWHSV